MSTGHATAAGPPVRRLTRDDVITAAELADIMGIAPRTVYLFASRGDIPGARRLGRRWVFSNQLVAEWLNGRDR